MREATGLSLREIGRRTGINSGRLSVIERGVPATEDEAAALKELFADLLTKPKDAA